MKAITCAVIALVCVVGLVVADYGYGGGYGQYIPIHPGYGGKGGFGEGGREYLFIYLYTFALKIFNDQIIQIRSFQSCWNVSKASRIIERRHEKTCFGICEHQRRRSACASAQSDQRLCCSLSG